MQLLEVRGAVRPIYGWLGVKRLIIPSHIPGSPPSPGSIHFKHTELFILVINQLDAQNFVLQYVYFMPLHVSTISTWCSKHVQA